MVWARHLVLAACASCASSVAETRPVAPPRIIVESIRCYVLPPVQFARGAATVAADSEAAVDALARPMIDDPRQFVLVEISGHASNDEPHPSTLAHQRATALRDALVARGVDASRLRVRSYGAHCTQRDSTSDAEAVFKDRRVEIRVLRTSDGETGAEVGCAAARTAGVE